MLFAQSVITMLFCWGLLSIFRRFASPLRLVDKPNARKLHEEPVALVGGISIVPALCIITLIFVPSTTHAAALSTSMLLIFSMGVMDDRIDLSAKVRLLIQIVAASIVVVFGGANISHVGNLLGAGPLYLHGFSELFSVVCIVTAINAFNMIDGTDGLLGGLVLVTLLALASLFAFNSHWMLVSVCLLSSAAMLPYIYANLQAANSGKKVFMGDAGSMTLGLFVSYLVICGSTAYSAYQPVTALFLIALPVFDIIRVFGARLSRGVSPFTPELNHLHHLLMFRGKAQAAIILIVSSAIIAALGSVLSVLQAAEPTAFVVFVGVLVLLMTKVQLAMKFGTRLVPVDVTARMGMDKSGPAPETMQTANQHNGS